MENKSYYPLRVGKNAGVIVSDQPVGDGRGHDDIDYYGGCLVAESIPSRLLAEQLVQAYNEKYGPKIGSTVETFEIDEQIQFIQERMQNTVMTEPLRDMYLGIKLSLLNLQEHLIDRAAVKPSDKFDINPCVDDNGEDMFKKKITDCDLIKTALEEGSITVAQSVQLYEVAETPGFKNLFIQMQYESKAAKVEHKINQEFLDKSRTISVDVAYELDGHSSVFRKFVDKIDNVLAIEEGAKIMIHSIRQGHKLLSCGNGGSYSDAQHFASELSGKYRGIRPAIAAIALSDGGAISCIANDFGYAHVFERQIEAIGKSGDVILCLSTSGNSENVILAAKKAKEIGITTIGICGNSGGELKKHLDIMIEVPHSGTADRIQEISIVIIHILVGLIEKGIA